MRVLRNCLVSFRRKLERDSRWGLQPVLIKKQSGTVIGFRDAPVMNGMFLSWTKGAAISTRRRKCLWFEERERGARLSFFSDASGLLHATVAYTPALRLCTGFLEPLLRLTMIDLSSVHTRRGLEARVCPAVSYSPTDVDKVLSTSHRAPSLAPCLPWALVIRHGAAKLINRTFRRYSPLTNM